MCFLAVPCFVLCFVFPPIVSTIGASLNLNAEECFHEAAMAAEQVKALPEGTPVAQVLRGVPISLKDQFHQAGFDSTVGAACKAFKPSSVDGLLVELLRDAGAIPFVRSNLPQCLMLPESVNNIVRGVLDVGRTPLHVLHCDFCSFVCVRGLTSGDKRTTRTTPNAPRTSTAMCVLRYCCVVPFASHRLPCCGAIVRCHPGVMEPQWWVKWRRRWPDRIAVLPVGRRH